MQKTRSNGLILSFCIKTVRMLTLAGIVALGAGAMGFWASQQGRRGAWDDIISERCWLNRESRQIECITYIPD